MEAIPRALDAHKGSRLSARRAPLRSTAPAASPAFVAAIQDLFGFVTEAHASATRQIWFILTTVAMTTIWQTRNETVHRGAKLTPAEVAELAWSAGIRQGRALGEHRTRHRETHAAGIALWQCVHVLEHAAVNTTRREWKQARLHFDGGARGNPGPSGRGWVLLKSRNGRHQWTLDSCGYKYQGPMQTNNYGEFEALREGLALAWRRTDNTATHLHIRGDSNMIIHQMQDRATIHSAGLRPTAQQAHILSRQFGWITWLHVRRERNKMADLLANTAMDSKSAHTMEDTLTEHGAATRQKVEAHLSNDTEDREEEGRDKGTLLYAFT